MILFSSIFPQVLFIVTLIAIYIVTINYKVYSYTITITIKCSLVFVLKNYSFTH